jgi:hypothetical protein
VDDSGHPAYQVVDVRTREPLGAGWAGNGLGHGPGLFVGVKEARAWIHEHPKALEEAT